ncbi:MAG TPA: ATP-binding protein [Pengzhenrongella sp.]
MGDREEVRARPTGPTRTPLTSIKGGRRAASRIAPTRPDPPAELHLPARTSSARLARHWVMNELAAEGVFGAENQVVELLTGELVANAALHGPSDGLVRVRAWRAGDTVCVAVRDDSPVIPVVRQPEPSAPSGRGLALVDSLAADWGIERHGAKGKTVWFSVVLGSV